MRRVGNFKAIRHKLSVPILRKYNVKFRISYKDKTIISNYYLRITRSPLIFIHILYLKQIILTFSLGDVVTIYVKFTKQRVSSSVNS